jgi:undecaprenyl-diphosphatase
VLDRVVPLVTYLGEGGAIWILLALVLLLRKDTRRYGLGVAVALVLDLVLCNLLLKPLVARPRPFTLREVTLLVKAPGDWSFPSGHTAASFAAAGALCFGKSKLGAPAVVLATLISLTRLYLYVHYPSDVVAGVAVGLLCGFLGTFFARKWIELCKQPSK